MRPLVTLCKHIAYMAFDATYFETAGLAPDLDTTELALGKTRHALDEFARGFYPRM